jgi:flagellar basal body rod protein FlgG
MQATSQQQDTIAHNLAHAVKPGYMRETMRFDDLASAAELQPPVTSVHTDFTPGTMQYTGNKLDLALKGPGFFTVQGPAGPVYTRGGTFQLGPGGQLVTMEGLPVLGGGGPIELPPGSLNIEVQGNGAIVVDGIEIDQVRVVVFQDPTSLQRAGTSFFQAPPNAPTMVEKPEVFQGYKELGNSTLVQEMVQMIAGVRHFEAAQRALRAISDAVAFNTRPLSR